MRLPKLLLCVAISGNPLPFSRVQVPPGARHDSAPQGVRSLALEAKLEAPLFLPPAAFFFLEDDHL